MSSIRCDVPHKPYLFSLFLCYLTQNHKTGCTIILSWWEIYDLLCLSETITPSQPITLHCNSLYNHIEAITIISRDFCFSFLSRPTGNSCDIALLALFFSIECQTRSLQFYFLTFLMILYLMYKQ